MNVRDKILTAIKHNDVRAAKKLIEPVIHPADKKAYGDLLLAATINANVNTNNRNIDIVLLLLQAGAVTSQKTQNDNTCFHLALVCRNTELFRHLLNHDLSGLSVTNSDNETPLQLAIKFNFWCAVKVFLQKITIDSPDDIEKYRNILGMHNQSDLTELLFKQGAAKKYVELVVDIDGNQYTRGYLHKAVESCDERAITQLLSSGFNLQMTDSLERTPEKFAAELDQVNKHNGFSTTLARAFSAWQATENIKFKRTFSILSVLIQANRQSHIIGKMPTDMLNHILSFLNNEKPQTQRQLPAVTKRLAEISTECKPRTEQRLVKTAASDFLKASYGLFRIHSPTSRKFISNLRKTLASEDCNSEEIQKNVNTFLRNNNGKPRNTLILLQQFGLITSLQQPAITLTVDDAGEKLSPQTPRALN